MMIFVRLFFEFFKAGLFAIGGGMATLPFLYNISDKTGWFTYGQLADMVAISESTPGPMGVNMGNLRWIYNSRSCWCSNCYTRSDHTIHYRDPDHCRILKGVQDKQVCSERFLRTPPGINRSDRGSRTFRSVLGSSSQGRFCGKRKDHRPDQHPQYRSSCSTLLFHGSLQKDERTPSGCVYCGICGDRSCASVRRSLKFK